MNTVSGQGSPAADGMIYYTSQIGPLAEGQSFAITIDYRKTNDQLSVESVPIQPSGPLDDSATGRWTLNDTLPYLLGGLGLLLIGGGGYWYWRSGQEKAATPKRKRVPPKQTPAYLHPQGFQLDGPNRGSLVCPPFLDDCWPRPVRPSRGLCLPAFLFPTWDKRTRHER